MTKSPPKLDIFKVLDAVDRRDFEFLSKLTEEARSGFAPVVAMRWASAVDGPLAEYAILATNKMANLHFFDLYDHPDLQYRLIASTGTGRRCKHYWIPSAKRSQTASTIHSYLSKYWPDANSDELDLIISQFDIDTFKSFVYADNDEATAKKLIEAFKRVRGDGEGASH